MSDQDTVRLLAELRHAQAVFQLRAISAAMGLPVWSVDSHLGALPPPPGPTSGRAVPGKSRRLKPKD